MSTRALLPGVRRVAVGSRNPVKVAAVRAALARCACPAAVTGFDLPSGVPPQPVGDDETLAGARNRAVAALAVDPGADLGVGIEGGVVRDESPEGTHRVCAWAVVVDRTGTMARGGSLAILLPPVVSALLDQGLELGDAMDQVAQTSGTKHGGGAVGVLTAGVAPLQQSYELLVTYALSRWISAELWARPSG
ncbi:MAG: DUF84 family protein [Gemmatimonadaceae bacterium]|nr:DUF84 family protein [Gemmatimonadaceae bacterium]